MTLNFDTLSLDRKNELKTITRTQILEYILSNGVNGLSLEDVMEQAAEYVNTPEELAYIVFLVTGSSVSAGLI